MVSPTGRSGRRGCRTRRTRDGVRGAPAPADASRQRLARAGAVVSYEPEPSNFAFLERSAGAFARGGGDWRVHRCAVGAEEGEATLHVSSESWAHSLLTPTDGGAASRAEKVAVVPLARILDDV